MSYQSVIMPENWQHTAPETIELTIETALLALHKNFHNYAFKIDHSQWFHSQSSTVAKAEFYIYADKGGKTEYVSEPTLQQAFNKMVARLS